MITPIYRARAPLRLGLAGGGTDVSPYSDQFGGCVLSAAIDLFSYCSIVPRSDNKVHFVADDRNESFKASAEILFSLTGEMLLHKAVYNRVVRQFNQGLPLPCDIVTYSDAPAGSGLGTSSTMVVAILGAFKEWLNLPLGEYEMAHLAFEIERIELGLAGGKQDQYSASFGGINFMEFFDEDRVIVNPLKINNAILNELELSVVLYYTGASRDSSKIISEQIHNVKTSVTTSVKAMHGIKENAIKMKEYLLRGELKNFSQRLGHSWEHKKLMSSSISNQQIEQVFEVAIQAGAYAGKVSGAGGGGYIMFITDPVRRLTLERALQQLNGSVQRFHFVNEGVTSWRSNK